MTVIIIVSIIIAIIALLALKDKIQERYDGFKWRRIGFLQFLSLCAIGFYVSANGNLNLQVLFVISLICICGFLWHIYNDEAEGDGLPLVMITVVSVVVLSPLFIFIIPASISGLTKGSNTGNDDEYFIVKRIRKN